MFTATTGHLDSNQDFQEAYERVKDVANHINSYLSILKAPKLIVTMLKIKRSAHKQRSMMLRCEKTCADFSKCFNGEYDFSKKIRDEHITLLSDLKASRHFFLKKILTYFVEDSLLEWDELTEDCLIGADDEIKNLVANIAESV